MSHWNDFNDAEQQADLTLIPRGTLAAAQLTLKPGGYVDPDGQWPGGWASHGKTGHAVYLAVEFYLLTGEFAGCKVWQNIGLYSPKGPAWGDMGRSFIRALLNSARGIDPNDMSDTAAELRRIADFGELDGLIVAVRIDIERDDQQGLRNIVKRVIEPNHSAYANLMADLESLEESPPAEAPVPTPVTARPAPAAAPTRPAPPATRPTSTPAAAHHPTAGPSRPTTTPTRPAAPPRGPAAQSTATTRKPDWA